MKAIAMFLTGKHVLVVEDNMLNLIVVKAFLMRWGAQAPTRTMGRNV